MLGLLCVLLCSCAPHGCGLGLAGPVLQRVEIESKGLHNPLSAGGLKIPEILVASDFRAPWLILLRFCGRRSTAWDVPVLPGWTPDTPLGPQRGWLACCVMVEFVKVAVGLGGVGSGVRRSW